MLSKADFNRKPNPYYIRVFYGSKGYILWFKGILQEFLN